MILKYDEERHDYIVEDLDDENHLVIKESQLENLKYRLDRVCSLLYPALANTYKIRRILTRRSCSWMNPSPNKTKRRLLPDYCIPHTQQAHYSSRNQTRPQSPPI